MKRIILFITLLGFPTMLFAQKDTVIAIDKSHKTMVFNPVIGLNFSAFNNEPQGLESKARLGWHIGANLRIGDQFYLQPGLQYVMLNSRFQSTSGPLIDTATLGNTDINMIRIPLLFGVRMLSNENKDNPLNLNVHAGIDLDFVSSINRNDIALTSNDFKSPIVGAVIGAGIDFLLFTFDVDYSFGLTPVFNESYTPFGKEPRNNTVLFTLGGKYQF